ncbi:MAG: ABC transporter permease [Bacteroidales bacterium]|nr:ABC transporter permease [Candidatus Physcousia equi]
MHLVWKLLRQHVSIGQLVGFFFANLLGMLIVLLSIQFYQDVKPAFSQEDSFIKNDYLIVSKSISMVGGLTGQSTSFSEAEIADIEAQPFSKGVGCFTATQYHVYASVGVSGGQGMSTDMFFESVPADFIDLKSDAWRFSEEEGIVPIILPRSYLAIYNFGFAPSQSLPKITEDVAGMVKMRIVMRGNGQEAVVSGRVVGFTNRINTILAPEEFIRWSNARFAPNEDASPTRLIVRVANPADEHIMEYFSEQGYEIADDKLDAGKTMFFLRIVSAIVMAIGLLISLLSFYILMLSIYLLVQKNTQKLQNLLLIGYSPMSVCLPYQLLTLGMNALVLLIAILLLSLVRSYYLDMLWSVFPEMEGGGLLPSVLIGLSLFLVVGIINVLAIRSKVMKIWKNKE